MAREMVLSLSEIKKELVRQLRGTLALEEKALVLESEDLNSRPPPSSEISLGSFYPTVKREQ